MKKYNILIVEDDRNIHKVIDAYLKKEGYNPLSAYDGQLALQFFKENKMDLALIDLMIPFKSGEDLIEEIRKESNIPLIILTAKADEDSRITGFTLGADDYITKPFSPREMVLRVKTLLKRVYGESESNIYSLNDLKVNFNSFSLEKNGQVIDLTTNEYKILSILIENKNQVLSREQLVELAFGSDYDGYNRTIDTHIKNLRRKIENDPKNPIYIKTVYGMGYIFNEKENLGN